MKFSSNSIILICNLQLCLRAPELKKKVLYGGLKSLSNKIGAFEY